MLLVDQQPFGVRRVARRIRCRTDQRLLLVIANPAERRLHDLTEQKVYRIRHLFPAAEIVFQRDAGWVLRRRRIKCGRTRATAGENLRHRLSKPIDALFNVADHEQVLTLPRKRLKQRILRGIGVLVFVHHDFIERFGQLHRQRGALSGFCIQ